jgi:dihydrofolate reductase
VKPFQAIAAMSINRVIGDGGKIPWHLPEDFKWFKQMTTGHIIVMGRKTFESIGRPLPNRTTIVLSRSAFSHPEVLVVHDLVELTNPSPGLAAIFSLPSGKRERERGGSSERKVFICGGAQVYQQALPFCSDLYLTLVEREVTGDAFFPPFEDKFELVGVLRDTPEFKILHYRNRSL